MSSSPPLAGDINVAALLADLERSHGAYLQQFRGKQSQLLNSNLGPNKPTNADRQVAVPKKTAKVPSTSTNRPTNSPLPVRFNTDTPKSPPPPSAEKKRPPKRLALPSPSAMEQDAAPIVDKEPTNSLVPAGPSAQRPIYVKDSQSDTSPASDMTDEGFTTVESKATKKRKLKASKSKSNPAKKQGREPQSKMAAEGSSSEDESSEDERSQDSSSEEEPMEQEPRVKAPPPLYIRQIMSWQDISQEMARQGIIFTTARSTAIGIRVQCPTSDDHRRLTDLLRARNVYYHTYTLPEDKLLRVVIRGLPKELNTALIKEDLQQQNLPVIEVARMRNFQTRAPYNMVLVSLELTPQGKNIFNIKTICSLSGLHIERPNNSGRMSQCHRCQLYGHAARNCFAKPRCVKCLGDHGTSECQRQKDEAEEPVRCVLCKGEGHPANYRGCPKAPREPHRRSKVPPKRQTDSQKPRSKEPPKTYVPAPAPQANAWDKPLNGPKSPPASTSAKPSPSSQSQPKSRTPKQTTQTTPAPQASNPNNIDNETLRSARNVEIFNEIREALDLDQINKFIDNIVSHGLMTALKNFHSLMVKVDQVEKNIKKKYNLK